MHFITPRMECCGGVSCLCIPVDKEESIERNHHCTIGKPSLGKQFHKSKAIRYCLV